MTQKPGFVIYFEDYASLRETLSSDDLVSVLDAMSNYAESGALPDEAALSDAARICWRFIRPKLERDSRLYAERVEKRRNAANARWSNGASACTCTDSMQGEQVQNSVQTKPIQTEPSETKDSVPRTRFAPPTLEEVRDYCREHGCTVDASRFCDFYASKGWKVGSQPMKDWRAAVRNWARREAQTTPPKQERGSPYARYESN